MPEVSETTFLINKQTKNGLSLAFAIICIVDVFGVFPIVALPKSVITCGYVGILVVIGVCGIQIYTASLLGRCWLIAQNIDADIKNKSRYPYSALAELTYGKNIAKFCTFLLDITIFGAGIPNLIVASQNLQMVGDRLSYGSFNISFCYWILIMGIALCPILWLGSPKDMKLLCTLSVFLVFSVFSLVLFIILYDLFTPNDNENIVPTPRLVPVWNSILSTYGILSFQFDIHPTILTIQMDMKNKEKITHAIFGGFTISLSMFVIICGVCAFAYGTGTRPNVLETLPSSTFLDFAGLLLALQLGLSSAVGNSALYQHMEDCMNISREFNHKRCLLRTCLTFGAILLAELVPRFDLVMSLIGGTLTGPLVFILPPLFFIKMLHLQKKHKERFFITNLIASSTKDEIILFDELINKNNCRKWREIAFCIFIVLIGIFMTIATTYVNVTNTIQFAKFSPPCIYNVTGLFV